MPSVPGYRASIRYVTKTWRVVLLNKKKIHSYLKCIVYDKLLKSRQSFRITLYNEQSRRADEGLSSRVVVERGDKNLLTVKKKKNQHPAKCYTGPRTWTDLLE